MSQSQPVVSSARATMIETLPEETSLFGKKPEVRFTHVPASHAKALHPDSQLVVGMRGAGKSFWCAALQSDEHRDLVAQIVPRAGLTIEAQVTVGFGETPQPGSYPGRDVLTQLVAHHDPRLIWRTVMLRALAGEEAAPGEDWSQRVRHVSDNPEVVERVLFEHDQKLDDQGAHWIILFDALDRSASDWTTMHALIRGLLQAILDLRPYRRLRAKCFLRTDQLNEREVATFPDASKLLATKVELTWPGRELYGLLFQYLGNSEGGEFRHSTEELFDLQWRTLEVSGRTAWLPPQALLRDEQQQRAVFHGITGPWMGRDHRRGFPYTWVPNHLADAEGRTSPRSFVAALRKAAQDTEYRYSDFEWPVHYESIKRGVQEASSIRVKELREDYPWVDLLMEPLRGKVVPCQFEEIAEAWSHAQAIRRLQDEVDQQKVRLPPASLEEDAEGLRADLESLGIFLRLKDGRVNIPDVFRVGYGLGRKGGVTPVGKGA